MTQGTPTRFPLAWPAHRPRATYRKAGKFSYRGDDGWAKDITVPRAMDRLEDEVRRLGGTNTLLSTNIDTRLDGRPRGGAAEPHDPGVCLYFTLKGKPMAMACDVYTKVAQNIAAVAAHLEATRAIERHGVATAAETLQAFQALPAPTVIALGAARPWREVLGFGEMQVVDRVDIDLAWKARVRAVHPDRGGSDGQVAEVNAARDAALLEVSP